MLNLGTDVFYILTFAPIIIDVKIAALKKNI